MKKLRIAEFILVVITAIVVIFSLISNTQTKKDLKRCRVFLEYSEKEVDALRTTLIQAEYDKFKSSSSRNSTLKK
jgi:F0F1-type ATP synthase membrane subunit a